MLRHFILLENSISTRNRNFLRFFGTAVQLAVFEDMKPHYQVLRQYNSTINGKHGSKLMFMPINKFYIPSQWHLK
jgi:hypothetical protein